MARLLLIDVENDDVREVECETLDDYYENLGCDCFDIAYRVVGNLIFANHDREGNTTSLSDDDIAIILSHIKSAMTFRNGEPHFHKVVVGVDYDY